MAAILRTAVIFVVALALAAPFAGADRHHRHHKAKKHQALTTKKATLDPKKNPSLASIVAGVKAAKDVVEPAPAPAKNVSAEAPAAAKKLRKDEGAQLVQKTAASEMAAQDGETTAEAVIAQAEEQQKEESKPVSAINAGAAAQVHGEDDESDSKSKSKDKKEEDSDDSEDGDDDDDDDKDEDKDTDSDSKDDDDDDDEEKVVKTKTKTLEIVSPLGKVVAARRALHENLQEQKLHLEAIASLKNRTAWTQQIDGQVKKVGAETNTIGLANFLGEMRKDLHRFSTPFYIQHLEQQVDELKKVQPSLQEKLDQATLELNGGQADEDIDLSQKLDENAARREAAKRKPSGGKGSGALSRKAKSGASSVSVSLVLSALLAGLFLQQ